MKTLTYAAAIALLTASAAFAQSSSTGASGSTQNMSGSGQTMQDQNKSGQSMAGGSATSQPTDIKGAMTKPGSKSAPQASRAADHSRDMSMSQPAAQRMAHANMGAKSDRSQDAQENQTTMQLNHQQLSGMSASTAPGMNGMSGNSFDTGRPQSAQAGGPNCTPDNPSCGTARDNPAINSSPQHRLYPASTGAAGGD